MARVTRLEHIGLGAIRDKFDETVQFYQKVFGWHLIKETPGQLAFIGDGEGGRLEVLPTDGPPLSGTHHLAFVVDAADMDATLQAIHDNGAAVGEPSTNPYGDKLVFFTDPAGNRAQIVCRREPLAP